MSRAEYEIIKNKMRMYIQTLLTKDISPIPMICSPKVLFYTSTSKTMADGAQHSLFGIYDFLNDFPRTKEITANICNEAYMLEEDKAYGYTEVVFDALNENSDLRFVVMISSSWSKSDNDWKIIELKQEIIPVSGLLIEVFSNQWYFESNIQGRLPMILGEEDSPWSHVSESYLSEEELVKDCIYKFYFGIEHLAFQHAYDSISRNYGAYTEHGMGEARRNLITNYKYNRILTRNNPCPIYISKVEIEGERAYVYGGKLVDLSNKDIAYTSDTVCSKNHYELVKEQGVWKITYLKEYAGIYPKRGE